MDSTAMHRRRWIILSVLIISLTAIVLDNTVLNIALKTIAEPRSGLGASQSQLEWAINSYTLVFAGLLFTFGVVGDRIGRRRMLIIGMALFGLSSLVSSYAQTPDQLIWARAAMGLGGAAVMPQTLSIITNVFDPKERARAIGIWASAVGVAIAVGPIAGGLLLDHFWWGSVFLINVPLTAVGIAAIVALVPESRSPSPGRVDYLGVLLSIAGLVLVVYGIIQGGDTGSWLRGDVLGPVAGGVAALAVFGWHEARTDHPSLDVRLFRDPRLSSAAAAISLVFFAMGGVYFFISFYTQNVRGYSPLHAGLLTIPLAVGQLLFATRSARLVRRFGAKVVCTTGLVVMSCALAGYHFLGTSTPAWVLLLTFLIQGCGMGLVMPAATEGVMSVVPRERGGAGSAITNTSRQVAVALGVAVLGSVLAQAYRTRLQPYLSVLPASARHNATVSIAQTQVFAAHLGRAGDRLLTAASSSFVAAMHVTALISVLIAVVGAVTVAIWMPGRVTAESAAAGTGTAAEHAPAAERAPAAGAPMPLLPREHSMPSRQRTRSAPVQAAEPAASAPSEPRRPGRPRSEQADQAILSAALDLFAECGPDALCIEQVAAKAGVGKATIYRRWPGKEDMLVDALGGLGTHLPAPQGRSVRADLIALLDAICREAADPRRARLFALLQGEGVRYPRLMAKYLETVVQPRRDVVRAVLRRGVATGELRENTDIDAATFLLNGAVLASMYGQGHTDTKYAKRVVEELLRGLAAR